MQFSDKDKKQILIGFIDILNRIQNKEYQRRVWIEGAGPEVDDFDDTVCDFFGECDPILENYTNFGITNNQYNLLIEFRDEFRKFSKRHDLPFDFLDTVEWTKITEMAQEVLQAFNYRKKQ